MRNRNRNIYDKQLLLKLAQYFAEFGLPKSYFAFKADRKKPVTDRQMVDLIGKYPRMLQLLKENHKEYWELAQPKVEIEPEVKDPLEALRASTTEK